MDTNDSTGSMWRSEAARGRASDSQPKGQPDAHNERRTTMTPTPGQVDDLLLALAKADRELNLVGAQVVAIDP